MRLRGREAVRWKEVWQAELEEKVRHRITTSKVIRLGEA